MAQKKGKVGETFAFSLYDKFLGCDLHYIGKFLPAAEESVIKRQGFLTGAAMQKGNIFICTRNLTVLS